MTGAERDALIRKLRTITDAGELDGFRDAVIDGLAPDDPLRAAIALRRVEIAHVAALGGRIGAAGLMRRGR